MKRSEIAECGDICRATKLATLIVSQYLDNFNLEPIDIVEDICPTRNGRSIVFAEFLSYLYALRRKLLLIASYLSP